MANSSGHTTLMTGRARALAIVAAATVAFGGAGSAARAAGDVTVGSTAHGAARRRGHTSAERFHGRYQLRLPEARRRATQ